MPNVGHTEYKTYMRDQKTIHYVQLVTFFFYVHSDDPGEDTLLGYPVYFEV